MNSSATLECAEPKTAGSTIRTGNLAVNIDEGLASVDGNAVKLTQREYAILELLSSRKGTIVTREMFLNRLYADRHGAGGQDHRYLRLQVAAKADTGNRRKPLHRDGVGSRLCSARPGATQAVRLDQLYAYCRLRPHSTAAEGRLAYSGFLSGRAAPQASVASRKASPREGAPEFESLH